MRPTIIRPTFNSHMRPLAGGRACRFELSIEARFKLDPVDPMPGADMTFAPDWDTQYRTGISTVALLPWGADFAPWSRAFKHSIERVWNNRLWLEAESSHGGARQRDIPAVRCSVKIETIHHGPAPHGIVRCFRPMPNCFFRSSMGRAGSVRPPRPIADFCFSDVSSHSSFSGGQVVTAHEFGHFLGLGHVNTGHRKDTRFMTSNTGANSEYGQTPAQRANIMGAGNRLAAWNATPFIDALVEHLDGQFGHVQWVGRTEEPVVYTVA